MAIPSNLFGLHTAVAVKVQSNYTTEYDTNADVNWDWLDCEVVLPDKLTLAHEVTELVRPQAVVGAIGKPLVGGRFGGELTIRGVIDGVATDEWAALDAVTASPLFTLVTDAIGVGYTVTAVEDNCLADSADTNMNVTLSTGYEVGCLVSWGDSTDQDPVTGMGWITTATDAATDTVTLAGTPATAAAATYDTLSTYTAAVTLDQPTPRTFRIVGHDVDWDLRLVSCVPKSCKLTFLPGQVALAEIVYSVGGYRWDEDDHGGLVDADLTTRQRTPGRYVNLGDGAAWHAYNEMPALTSGNGGRVLIDGTAWTRGLGAGIEVTVTNRIDYMRSPGGYEGVAGAVVAQRDVEVRLSAEVQDSDRGGTAGDYQVGWSRKFEEGTSTELDLQLGVTAGQLLAIYAPALYVAEQPKLVTVGEITIGEEVLLRPGVPSGDDVGDGTTACENTVFRIAVG